MKKFACLVLITCLCIFVPTRLYAQEATMSASTSSQLFVSPTIIQSQSEISDQYILPYPGILPDNPLYFLKAFRDRLVSFLIADLLKKAQFDLLEADKRLAAAMFLFDEHPRKEELAETTISKGENYFEYAIMATREAKQQGMDISDIVRKLATSSQKHKYVIEQMKDQASPAVRPQFIKLLQRVLQLQKEVDQLKS